MEKTIISYFYNEEYLLPWWLEHHKKIFNHGILINHGSTDNSVNIVKKICPDWEIINAEKVITTVDGNEIMAIEENIKGYKICLTTAEFFINNGIDDLLIKDLLVCEIPEIFMVDNKPEKEPTYDKDLTIQKRYGVPLGNHRILHNHPNGKYGEGRHRSNFVNANIKVIMDSYIFQYKFSPWTEEFIKRKMQFGDTVHPDIYKAGHAGHYLWDREKQEEEYQKYLLNKRCKLW